MGNLSQKVRKHNIYSLSLSEAVLVLSALTEFSLFDKNSENLQIAIPDFKECWKIFHGKFIS